MPRTKQPLLNLSDVAPATADREPVTLGGKNYYFIERKLLTLRMKARINNMADKISKLQDLDDPTDADAEEYKDLLIEFAVTVLPGIEEAREQLEGVVEERMDLMEHLVGLFFGTYVDLFAMRGLNKMLQNPNLIGGLLSQGLSTSIAAQARSNGST